MVRSDRMKYDQIKKRRKKYKVIIIIGLIILIILLLTVNIYHRLLGNVDQQSSQQKELLLQLASNYQTIIQKEIKKVQTDSLYMINNNIIERQDLKKQTVVKVSNIGADYAYGTLLYENGDYQYMVQIEDYCITQESKDSKLNIRKGICHFTNSSTQIAQAIRKYSVATELVTDDVQTGLNQQLPFSSKQYFVGENPDNYIVYADSCYRIMGISQNDTVKIIYEGPINEKGSCQQVATNVSGYIGLLPWDKDKESNIDWSEPTSLSFEMSDWVEMGQIDMKNFKVMLNKDQLEMADWFVGRVANNDSIEEDIIHERSKKYQAMVGLITPSDYNKISCKRSAASNSTNCKEHNYLYKDKYSWWTLNRTTDETKSTWSVNADGKTMSWTVPYSNEYSYKGIRPVFYLKANLEVSGFGTDFAPFIII
jgi:hypothetical protein